MAFSFVMLLSAPAFAWFTPNPTNPGCPTGGTSRTTVSSYSGLKTAMAAHNGNNDIYCLNTGTYSVTDTSGLTGFTTGDTLWGLGDRRGAVNFTPATGVTVDNVMNLDTSDNVTLGYLGVGFASWTTAPSNASGRGIANGGTGTILDHIYTHDNGMQGVGGQDGVTILNSIIQKNGTGVSDGESAGVKGSQSVTIKNSWVHDNTNSGIWCDVQCNTFVAKWNDIFDNSGDGIHEEISDTTNPADLSFNFIKGNNYSLTGGLAGLALIDSVNSSVESNYFTSPDSHSGEGATHGANGLHGIYQNNDLNRTRCGPPSSTCGFEIGVGSDDQGTNTIFSNELHGETIDWHDAVDTHGGASSGTQSCNIEGDSNVLDNLGLCYSNF